MTETQWLRIGKGRRAHAAHNNLYSVCGRSLLPDDGTVDPDTLPKCKKCWWFLWQRAERIKASE